MRWPQITLIALYALGLGITLSKEGEPRDPYDFWSTLIATGIQVALLAFGGFFS